MSEPVLNLRRGELPGCLADTPDDAYHAILTDPPYGLGEIRDLGALLRSWLDGEDGEQGPGMLNRDWDVVVPPSAWREYLRVTRPGGLCFAYSHARTCHLQALAMQLAGWRILPMITRIHGSAMALGHAVGKAIDKAAGAEREVVGTKLGKPGYSLAVDQGRVGTGERSNPEGECSVTAPATPLATLFDGHATAIRNNIEPIVVAVKPPDGTWAENASRWGCGAFNVQDGRVPSGPDHAANCASVVGCDSPDPVALSGGQKAREDSYNPAGRYPSNLLLEHSPDCGADWCASGCGVRELSGEERTSFGTPGGRSADLTGGDRSGRKDRGERKGYAVSGNASRYFYQARASARERAAGCEHLLWLRDPKHPDGWELTDRETWERVGDEAAAKARETDGYRERMVEGYMRRNGKPIQSRGAWSESLERTGRDPQVGAGVLDVDRLDAAAYLDAARARVRATGSPHLAVKPLDGGAYLAKLLLQPVVDGEEPRLAVFYAGTGSETIGGMLAGWKRIDAFEGSEQWNVVHEARWKFWRDLVEKGGKGKALELLRGWGTTTGEDPEAEPEIEQLSIFDVAGGRP